MTIRAFRPAQRILFADTFTAADGSALSAAWVASGATVVGNAMKIDPGATAWNNKVYAMLGVPDSLAGNTLIGPAPSDFDAVFNMTLTDTNQQYPHIGLRVQPRTASGAPDNQWNGGGGDGGFKLGYDLVLRVQEGDVQVMNNRTGATVGAASVGFATLGRFLNWRVLVRGSRIAFKVWAVGATEPGTYAWTFDSDTAAADTTPGYIGFTASSGPSGAQPVLIDNLTVVAAA